MKNMKEFEINDRLFSVGSLTLFIILFILIFSGFSAGEEKGFSPGKSFGRPNMVYVADFSLDTGDTDKGSLGPLHVRTKVKDRIDQQMGDSPQEKARKIVDLLAQSIVQELNEKNVKSLRYPGQNRLSSKSWLLEGEFVEYDEGDRLKRTIIGFGRGSADMEITMKVSEVHDGVVTPLFDSTMDGKKNRMPGAAVTKNSYVAGATFVMTKSAPAREVKKMGIQIADRLYEVIQSSTIDR